MTRLHHLVAGALVCLSSSCAYQIGTQVPVNASFAIEARGTAGSPDGPTAEELSFESAYRDQVAENGRAGVAAESVTSVLESMALLCGADTLSNPEVEDLSGDTGKIEVNGAEAPESEPALRF